MITQTERKLIRSCLSNGFAFKERNDKIVVIDGVEINRDCFEKMLLEVEQSFDVYNAVVYEEKW